jgi:hypothetical protein
VKFSTLPPFKATGKVAVYQSKGFDTNVIELVVTVYTTDSQAIASAMESAAKWQLERLGVPVASIRDMGFEYSGTDHLVALEPKGVKQVWGEAVEGFFDGVSHSEAKRATLIRQRRLLPHDHAEALAIYGKPVQAKQEEAVAA